MPKWPKGADCKSVIRRFESGRRLSIKPPETKSLRGFFVRDVHGSDDDGCELVTVLERYQSSPEFATVCDHWDSLPAQQQKTISALVASLVAK